MFFRPRFPTPLTIVLAVVLMAGWLSAQTAERGPVLYADTADCQCLRSKVRFDVSSVEKIILQPEKILEDPEKFWQEDAAYRHVRMWHDQIEQPPDLQKWRDRIQKLAEVPPSERETHPQLATARNLAGMEGVFLDKAVPYLCGFLPPEADLSTTIYFTTEMLSAGFAGGGNIVIHILNGDVHNLFVHELLHRGHASIQSASDPPLRERPMMERMRFTLLSEGMATYIGYAGRDQFPQVGKVGSALVAGDYAVLDQPEEIVRLRTGLNELFQAAPSMDPDSLRVKSFEFGVNQRAYYVVGASMAQLIDEDLGRAALVETLVNGPSSFIATYNRLVDDSLKIRGL